MRRRLNDDTSDRLDKRVDGPQFLGKTPVKDISALLPTANLSTHMSRMFIDQVHEYLSGGLHYSKYKEKWIRK